MYNIVASIIILLLIIFNRELPYKRRSHKAVVSISCPGQGFLKADQRDLHASENTEVAYGRWRYKYVVLQRSFVFL